MTEEQETKARTYNLSIKAIENLEYNSKKDRRTVSNFLTVLLERLDNKKKVK